jgi:outer membrane protein TolC
MNGGAEERLGVGVTWRPDPLAAPVDERVRDLLAQGPLDADRAARVALAANPHLQSAVESIGIARGDVLGSARWPNPRLSAEVRFPEEGDEILDLSAQIDVGTMLLLRPAERGAADAALSAAQVEALGAAVDVVGQARGALVDYQADLATLEQARAAEALLDGALDLQTRIHAAGNSSDLDLAHGQAATAQARVDRAAAERSVATSRERLALALGLTGSAQPTISVVPLPPVPDDAPMVDAAEASAVERSLDLAAARSRVEQADAMSSLASRRAWLPALGIGAAAERESDGEWSYGPAVSLGLPLFDQNQGGQATADASLRQAQARLTALALQVRAAAREAAQDARSAWTMARYHAQQVVPVRQRVLAETQLHYNGMLVSAFQLFEARRALASAVRIQIESTRDYWRARQRLDTLLAGRLPGFTSERPSSAGFGPADASEGAH